MDAIYTKEPFDKRGFCDKYNDVLIIHFYGRPS